MQRQPPRHSLSGFSPPVFRPAVSEQSEAVFPF